MKDLRKLTLLVVVSLGMMSCVTLLPREERRVEKVYETTLSKKEIYDRALVHLAKSLGNANMAIQIRDLENGRIVSQGTFKNRIGYSCLYGCLISFNVDFTAKDKKYRIIFDDLEKWSLNEYGAKVSLLGPSSQKDIVEMKKEYLDAIEKELVGSIEGRFMAPKEDF